MRILELWKAFDSLIGSLEGDEQKDGTGFSSLHNSVKLSITVS